MTPEFDGRALPLAKWPDADRQAWEEALKPAWNLWEDTPAAKWRDSSRELFLRCYSAWLAWLAAEGLLKEHQSPIDRLSPERLLAYLQARRSLGNRPRTLVNQAVGLKRMFEVLAPDADLRWMRLLIGKLKKTVSHKVKASNLPSSAELFALGIAVMNKADKVKHATKKQRAKLYRDGLAIAMLACRPFMRRNNLAGIRMGKHLRKEGAVYWLRFSGDEMKGRRPKGGPLPVELSGRIERYWNHYRPALFGKKCNETDVFWISKLGNPAYAKSFATELMGSVSV